MSVFKLWKSFLIRRRLRTLVKDNGITGDPIIGFCVSVPYWGEPYSFSSTWVESFGSSNLDDENTSHLRGKAHKKLELKEGVQVVEEGDLYVVIASKENGHQEYFTAEFVIYVPGQKSHQLAEKCRSEVNEFWHIWFPREQKMFSP